jgi:DNA-directed RNA polymerase specialized sigma24 family protein
MRRERLRQVAKAMMLLPKNQRLGIQLRMQGLRYRAIAEIMDVSVSTVAEWLSLAVERLRSAANE